MMNLTRLSFDLQVRTFHQQIQVNQSLYSSTYLTGVSCSLAPFFHCQTGSYDASNATATDQENAPLGYSYFLLLA